MSIGDDLEIEDLPAMFDGKVQTFRFPGIGSETGVLTPINLTQLPLKPVHAFMIHAADGATRGGHAHASGQQLLVRIQGEIRLELRWRGETRSFVLDEHDNAVLVSSPVWSRQTYFGDPACIMVFCDTPYDPADYIDGD